MGLFDMGPMEIFLILIIALIIWGPGKIPEIARTLGRMVRSLRKLSSEFTTAITKELDTAENELPQSKGSSKSETKPLADTGGTKSGDTPATTPEKPVSP